MPRLQGRDPAVGLTAKRRSLRPAATSLPTVTLDLDSVAALIREVADAVVLPRHRRLVVGDVEEKSPGELVTIADREAEEALSGGLSRLLPGVPVIGEEAAADDPSLLNLLPDAPRVWLVDPIDGTSNFVAGSDDFAVMVALVERGETVASWIHQPASGVTYQAERGAGAYCDGVRLGLGLEKQARPLAELRGAALSRFMTLEQQAAVATGGAMLAAVGPGHAAAGVEYPLVANGEQDFVLFWRTLPWDHAPGALLVTEAGGIARHLNGHDYCPGRAREGLLIANHPMTWDHVARAFSLDG
jgi:fructose-1,6-bisphosphatase/inositol monophosphatase family enzyme